MSEMSVFNEHPFGPDIKAPLLFDAGLRNSFEDAYHLQARLDLDLDTTQEYRDSEEEELNTDWPRLDFPVSVTGVLRPAPLGEGEDQYFHHAVEVGLAEVNGDNTLGTVLALDDQWTSQGFKIVEDGRIFDGQTDMGARYAVKLVFSKEVTLSQDQESTEIECVGDIDQVIMKFEEDSEEQTEYVARYYFPEYTDWVDAQLGQCTTTAEGVLALRNKVVLSERYIGNHEWNALREHLACLLEINKEGVPYEIECATGAAAFQPGKGSKKQKHELRPRELVRVFGMELQPVSKKQPNLYEPRLIVRVHERTADKDGPTFAVRFNDIVAMRNSRDVFHDTLEKMLTEDQ